MSDATDVEEMTIDLKQNPTGNPELTYKTPKPKFDEHHNQVNKIVTYSKDPENIIRIETKVKKSQKTNDEPPLKPKTG